MELVISLKLENFSILNCLYVNEIRDRTMFKWLFGDRL